MSSSAVEPAKDDDFPAQTMQPSALDGAGPRIPRHRTLPEIRFVCHVASQSSIVSKHGVFNHRLTRTHCLEEAPQMRFHVVPGVASIGNSFEGWFLPRNWIVFLMPLLEIFFAQSLGKTESVIARRRIHSSLRNVGQRELGQLQNSFRPLKSINLRSLRTKIEAHVHRHLAILKQGSVDVRHIAAIFPT